MPKYAVLFNWTEQGIKTFKDSPGRVDAATEPLGEAGITIDDIYWTVGPHDLVGIFTAPDDETLAAAMLTLGAQGNVRTTTMRAFTQEEFNRVIERAG
jgi:uncharacterized protein with GYD domain